MISPEQALARIQERFGVHPGYRAFHAKGTILTGTFTATPGAAQLTRAAHMQGEPAGVIARLSNGGGNPDIPDYAPDVRGIGVSFELPDGSRTDIMGQTAPRFPVKTPDAFFDMLKATERTPAALVKLPLFLLRNPGAIGPLRANVASIRPPTSYATCTFYAVHAFRWIDASGGERWVRYTFEPERAAPPLSSEAAKAAGRDYLRDDLAERIGNGPVRFKLQLQIAAGDDDPHDPTSVWPESRQSILAGTIELTEITDEHETIIFDPMRLTDGIEPSDDPILRYRPASYSASYAFRTA